MNVEMSFFNGRVALYHGDAIESMAILDDAIADAIVTDPPYELGFMGRAWDASGIAYNVELWKQCLRVLKPGGHLLAFGGTRTSHRMACAIEDAGFELRDSIAWIYGSGFPKSLDISKAIDKAAGAPATDDAQRWAGWGTALKPAHEPIVVARKPLRGTVAANVLAHGTGALNIDACRVPAAGRPLRAPGGDMSKWDTMGGGARFSSRALGTTDAGRWPTNVVLDEAAAAEMDERSGTLTSDANPTRRGSDKFRDAYGEFKGQGECTPVRGADSGGASRFFPTFRYQAKAPTKERPKVDGVAHPTVKPLDLMRWLVRLVTPPSGIVLDPFAGSGTTAEACLIEGMYCLTIEREATYMPLIMERIERQSAPLDTSLGLQVGSTSIEQTDERSISMSSPFSTPIAPGAPDPAPRPRDLEGCLVAYSPTGFTAAGAPGNDQPNGNIQPRDRVTANLLILDVPQAARGVHQPAPGMVYFGGSPDWDQDPKPHYLQVTAPARFEGAWINNTTIVRALAPNGQPLTGQMVLGRIVRSTVGQKPFNLQAVAGTPDEQLALQVWQQINTINPQTGAPMRPLAEPQPIPGVAPPAPRGQQNGAPAGVVNYAQPPMPPPPAPQYAPAQQWQDPGVAAVAAVFPGVQAVGGAAVPGLYPGMPGAPSAAVPQPPVPQAPAAPGLPAALLAQGWTPETWATLSPQQQAQVLAATPVQ